MAATAWTKQTTNPTAYTNSFYIVLLGVLMNDTGYLMNDTVALMNDQQLNPAHAGPTAYTKQTTNPTPWTKT